jgi:chorismate-pyruvate lyase
VFADFSAIPYRPSSSVPDRESGPVRWLNGDEFLKSDAAHRLAPALRALLTSDGSITLLLQSLLLTSIEVEVLRQEDIELDQTMAGLLSAVPGSAVLARDVWLTAKGRRIVSASSVILVGELSPLLLRALRSSERPMGLLLQESGERVTRDRLQIASDAEPSGLLTPETYPVRRAWIRRYRMSLSSRPVALIQERFALDLLRP